jgi:hypothetical protein
MNILSHPISVDLTGLVFLILDVYSGRSLSAYVGSSAIFQGLLVFAHLMLHIFPESCGTRVCPSHGRGKGARFWLHVPV